MNIYIWDVTGLLDCLPRWAVAVGRTVGEARAQALEHADDFYEQEFNGGGFESAKLEKEPRFVYDVTRPSWIGSFGGGG